MRRPVVRIVLCLAVVLALAAACGPAPGDASLALDFTADRGGTIVDRNGRGTGFTSCQPNGAIGCDASKLTVDPTNGRLSVVSTAGSNTGATNTQANALQVAFDARRLPFQVVGRIRGIADLTQRYQQKAIFFGPTADDYVKVEAERGTNDMVSLTVAFEQHAAFQIVYGPVAFPSPGSITTLDLRILGDPVAGTLQASYRTATVGAFTTVGPVLTPAAGAAWFDADATAGILVSHTGTTTPITGVFDLFRVDAA